MAKLERVRGIVLCVAVSGSALCGVFHAEGQALRARPPVDAPAPRAVARTTSADVLAAVPGAAALALTLPEHEEVEDAQPETVRVPNLVGLRLTTAADRAERVGLTVVAVDEDGNEVDLVYSRFYRVLRQSVRRGTKVVSGHVIEIRVRDRSASYSDWG